MGVDAEAPEGGPAAESEEEKGQHAQEVQEVVPKQNPQNGICKPGSAPTQAAAWAVESLAKAGTLSIIGVYPQTMQRFPIGQAMQKNLTIKMGNCNHRRYVPELVRMVAAGRVGLTQVITQEEPLAAGEEAFEAVDQRKAGWIKVELAPSA